MTTTGHDDGGFGGLEAARRAGQTLEPAGADVALEDLARAELDESSEAVIRDVRGDR